MYYGRTILTLLSFILSINRQCLPEPLYASAQYALKMSSSGTYALQVENSFGCTGSDTGKVETKKCPSGIFFSNAFAPNKDGRNHIFKPQMFSSSILYQPIIYNRWGKLVFESNDPGVG
jgi:hypothetical protein